MSEARLPKPNLRNLHALQAKRILPISVGISIATGLIYKVLVCDPFEKKLEDFYKTYDAEAALKRMNDAGLMQSCPK